MADNVEVDWSELDALPKDIEAAAVRAMEQALEALENIQVKAYGQNSNPSKPPGSRYQRTFALRDASRTQMISRRLPLIVGRWDLDGSIDYGDQVVGTISQQAPIHRGRWKSEEEVIDILDPMTQDIFDEEIQKIK